MSDVCNICGWNPSAPAGCRCTDETREAFAAGAAAERARIVAWLRKGGDDRAIDCPLDDYGDEVLKCAADALEAGAHLEERKP